MDNLDWFWQTDRVIAVLHVAGARGAAIHQLITYSPEVDKRKSVEVHHGAAHINQEGLGYRDPLDRDSQYHMYARWDGVSSGRWPRAIHEGKSVDDIKSEIAILRTGSGYTLPESVSRGNVLTYRNHPGMDDGDRIWPNRRVVAVYNARLYNSLRDWHTKGLALDMLPWQKVHMSSLGFDDLAKHGTVLDYYTICHAGASADKHGYRIYLRQCFNEMSHNQERMLSKPGIHAINADAFFVQQGWQAAYIELCDYCGITPNMDMASSFMDTYMSQQWKRYA